MNAPVTITFTTEMNALEGLDLLYSNPEGVLRRWVEVLENGPRSRAVKGHYRKAVEGQVCFCATGVLQDMLGYRPHMFSLDGIIGVQELRVAWPWLQPWDVVAANDTIRPGHPWRRAAEDIRRQAKAAGYAF